MRSHMLIDVCSTTQEQQALLYSVIDELGLKKVLTVLRETYFVNGDVRQRGEFRHEVKELNDEIQAID